jgi:hypothetical protein
MNGRQSRDAVRRHAEQFAWGPTTQGLLQLFADVLECTRACARPGSMRAPG